MRRPRPGDKPSTNGQAPKPAPPRPPKPRALKLAEALDDLSGFLDDASQASADASIWAAALGAAADPAGDRLQTVKTLCMAAERFLDQMELLAGELQRERDKTLGLPPASPTPAPRAGASRGQPGGGGFRG